MGIDPLRLQSVMIDGVYYRVEPFPHRKDADIGPYTLKKGIAYRYETDITKGLFPYRGLIGDDFHYATAKVGLWCKKVRHDRYKIVVIRPRTAKEKEEHRIGRERDIVAATLNNEYSPDQFMDNQLTSADIGTDVYIPQIYADDDFLNMLMKLAIRLKAAPFEPYGRRMEALAVDKSKGSVERSNSRNNVRRAIRVNHALSPSKFGQYGGIWQTIAAVILKDAPDAMHPMHIPDKKKGLIIYPDGIPFAINSEDYLDVSELISDAIAASAEEDRIAEIQKNQRKSRPPRKPKVTTEDVSSDEDADDEMEDDDD